MFAIRAARLFDGDRFSGGGATVLIDRGRVVGVEEGFPVLGERCQVVDMATRRSCPG